MSKICSKCKIEKDINEFYYQKNGKYHVTSICKLCMRNCCKIYKKTEKGKMSIKKYRDTHKLYYQNYSKIHNFTDKLKRNHNLSKEEYETILLLQNNTCAICHIDFIELNKKDIHIDHDHTAQSHRIRGILCQKCNNALGLFNDNIANLKTAISYLENNI